MTLEFDDGSMRGLSDPDQVAQMRASSVPRWLWATAHFPEVYTLLNGPPSNAYPLLAATQVVDVELDVPSKPYMTDPGLSISVSTASQGGFLLAFRRRTLRVPATGTWGLEIGDRFHVTLPLAHPFLLAVPDHDARATWSPHPYTPHCDWCEDLREEMLDHEAAERAEGYSDSEETQ